MKKILSLVLALSLLLSLALSGATAEAANYTIGICQIVQHPALDAATQGFKDALNELLPGQVTFKDGNASGEINNVVTIINGYVTDKVDMILANATPPLTSAASATTEIPILGTSVTDYASALEVEDWTGVSGRNISGTTDLAPLADQAKMIPEWFPEAKKVGILYCSAEANSVYQAKTIKDHLEDLGLEVSFFAFTDSNDVAPVTQLAADNSDVIYIPTDNTAASNTEAIANIVLPAKKPVIAGEEGLMMGCGVATLSISYYDLGYETGKMAAEVLTGAANIAELPVRSASNFTKKYHAANVELLGLTVPEGYVPAE